MSALRAAIASRRRQPFQPIQPRAVAIAAVADALPGRGGCEAPPRQDFNRIAQQIHDVLARGEVLTSTQVRHSGWCLWRATPALADTEVGTSVLGAIRSAKGRRAYAALASSFVVSFDPERHGMKEAAALLAAGAAAVGRPWAPLQETYRLFDLEVGPRSVAEAARRAECPPGELLRAAGLGTLDADSGYARACVAALLMSIAQQGAMDHSRRIDLVLRVSLNDKGRLAFAEMGPYVANALVLPFGEAAPSRALLQSLLNLLIGLFGDPRLHPGRWARMADAAAMVRRWLAGVSLRQFLDVVDKVAVERMWKYRRAFWEAVLRAGLISDAWVVFDGTGETVARRVFGDRLPFGRLGKGVQSGQAVLMMKMGRSLVAEWSHNGRCIIWRDAASRDAPSLFQPGYDPAELRYVVPGDVLHGPVFVVSHTSPETYNWQYKVAKCIHETTGLFLDEADYRLP